MGTYADLGPPPLTPDFAVLARLQGYAARLGIIERRFQGWDYVEEDTQQDVSWGSVYTFGVPAIQLNLQLVKPSYVLFYAEVEMSGNFPQAAVEFPMDLRPAVTTGVIATDPRNGLPWDKYGNFSPGSGFTNATVPNTALWAFYFRERRDVYFQFKMACTATSGTASFRNRKMWAAVL